MNLQSRFWVVLVLLCTCPTLPGCSCTPDEYQESAELPSSNKTPPKASATPPAVRASSTSPLPKPSASATSSGSASSAPPAQSNGGSSPSNSSGTAGSGGAGGGAGAQGKPGSGVVESISNLFGSGAPSGSQGRGKRGESRNLPPAEAATQARRQIAEAKEQFSDGEPGAALRSGIAAYELLAPHAADATCGELLRSLEADLRRYSDAANLEPVSPAKPSSIR